MASHRDRTVRGALAGAAAAATWAAQQPLDKRVFASRYDDVELLGKAVTRGRAWYPVGLWLHCVNGALFGAAYANVAPLAPLPTWARGPVAGLAEHVGLWPAGRLTDRFHPAREQLPRLTGNRRAFAQATWRHALFGVVLGELERRLNPHPEALPVVNEDVVSSNGHGSLEQLVSARAS
jgi:hypothetical protein